MSCQKCIENLEKCIQMVEIYSRFGDSRKGKSTIKKCQHNKNVSTKFSNRQKAQTLIGLLCCWSLPFCSMSWSTASATVFFCRRSLGGCGPGGAACAAIENLFHGSCANASCHSSTVIAVAVVGLFNKAASRKFAPASAPARR